MLRQARLGLAVMSQEGASSEALAAADLVLPDILSALGLLDHPLRMIASLRR
jgi:soluble P-type ATPase